MIDFLSEENRCWTMGETCPSCNAPVANAQGLLLCSECLWPEYQATSGEDVRPVQGSEVTPNSQ